MSKGRVNRKKTQGVGSETKKQILNTCRNTEDMDILLNFSKDEDPDIRL